MEAPPIAKNKVIANQYQLERRIIPISEMVINDAASAREERLSSWSIDFVSDPLYFMVRCADMYDIDLLRRS